MPVGSACFRPILFSDDIGRTVKWWRRAVLLGLATLVALLALTGTAQAQSTCPPGPTYDDAHSTPGGRVCVPLGDIAFASSVVSFVPGTYTLNTPCPNTGQLRPPTRPANQNGTASGALGPPDVPFSQFQTPNVRLNNDASLGGRGRLVLRFTVPLTGDGNTATPDVWVWEVGQFAELYTVEVSPDGTAWTLVGQSNTTTNGSQGFDIDHAGFNQTSRLFFVRIVDVGNMDDGCQAGADIDAVAVLSSITPRIALVKSANPASEVRVGDVIAYTFTVNNTGTDTLLNVRVVDPHPGLAPIACGQTTISPGASMTCTSTYVVTQEDFVNGLIENTATVTADPEAGGPPATSTHTTTVTVLPLADLTIAKTHATPFPRGGTGVYTVTVSNVGNAASSGVVSVTDTVPTALTATAMAGDGWTCTLATLSCSRSDLLLPSASYPPITISVTVAPDAPIQVTNGATVSGGGDSNPANNTATDPTPIVGPPPLAADLAITKSRPLQATSGANLTYSLRIENLGPGAASGVVVNDPTPAGLTFVSNTGGCVTAFPCALGTIPVNGVVVIGVTFFVPASYAGSDPIVNVATVTATTPDPNTANNTATALTPLGTVLTFNVGVTKAGPANVLPGRNVTYTLTVTNSGTADATAVTLSDPTPPGLTFVSNAGDCATPFPCVFGTLTPDESRIITTTFAVPAGYAGPDPIVNTATVTSTSPDDNPADNTSTTTTAVVPPWADIAVSKVVDVPAPAQGQVVTYTVTATNHGPTAATGVELVDRLPAGLSLIGATPAQGTYDPPTGRWSIGAIAVGASTTLTFTAQVTLPGTIVNTAIKVAGDQPDPNDSNNSGSAVLTVQPVADVRVLVLVDRPTVNVGETVTITVIVHDAGPNDATSVLTQITVAPGLVPLSLQSISTGTIDPATGQWTIGSLPVDGTATLVFVARVTEPTALPVTAVKIAQTEFDPDLTNDASGVVVNGLAADVQIVKTADVTSVTMGQRVRFTIVATNNGPSDATGLVVRDALGPNLAFVSAVPSQGTYAAASGLWTVGILAAAGPTNVATLTVEAVVVGTGALSNTATVQSADQPDPNIANNTDSTDFQSAALDLAASLSAIGNFGAIDTIVKFFPGIANVSDAPSSGRISFMVTLPPELEYISPPVGWTCTAPGGVVSCFNDGLVLLPGQQVTPIFFAAVRGILAEPTFVPLVIANAADVNPLNNMASIRVDATLVIDPADLEVRQTVATGTAAAGVAFAAVVDVENHGPDPARRVVTLHALPDGLTLAALPAGCQGSHLVICDLGRLAAGASVQVTLQVTADAPGVYRLVSSATSLEDDPRPGNNQAATGVTVTGSTPPTGTPGGAAPPFGYVDLPADGATVAGAVAVGGWALDDVEVMHVRIYRDPVDPEPGGTLIYIGDAVQVRGARPDVERAFPGVPFAERAGWGLLVLTNTLPNRGNGTFRLHAVAEDRDGQQTLLGSRTIVAANASSAKPFGTIDTPRQGETIAGSAYLNFGWALTPPPKTIPVDGSTILVLVDGQAVGTVSYNHARDDVAALFADYANAAAAIGFRVIDATTLANGMHTISWTVTDDAGVTEGLGSRYFFVDNAVKSEATVTAAMRAPAARGPVTTTPAARVLTVEMQPMVIDVARVDGDATCGPTRYVGFEAAASASRPLPVGSTLDAATGQFTWQPGPGFVGRYRLVFTRDGCGGNPVAVPVEVIIQRR